MIPTTNLGGLSIAVLDRRQTAHLMLSQSIERRGQGRPCLYHTAANGQVIAEWPRNKELEAALRDADVISVDSMPMVFLSKYVGSAQLPERCTTTDVYFDVAKRAEKLGVSFFLLGADEESNRRAAKATQEMFPNLKIAGRHHGFFSQDEEQDVVSYINAAEPDILWVGMGVPRQEAFALRNRRKLTKVGLLKTCGGCFRYLSGELKRAPLWMQHAGLEWAFLASQDRLRVMRYVKTNPVALYRLVMLSSDRRSALS